MSINENVMSLASNERIEKLIQEAESELLKIQPEIDYLEQCNKKLIELKDQQFKLNTMIMSLKSIIKTTTKENVSVKMTKDNLQVKSLKDVEVVSSDVNNVAGGKREVFLPDQAFSYVKNYLRTKNNLNFEIFKAVVCNSGEATTEQIKTFLVENDIKQPKSGKGFEDVELKEISSRINYLVRKNILVSPEPGKYRSIFGWSDIS